jgi:hypothetical protein
MCHTIPEGHTDLLEQKGVGNGAEFDGPPNLRGFWQREGYLGGSAASAGAHALRYPQNIVTIASIARFTSLTCMLPSPLNAPRSR